MSYFYSNLVALLAKRTTSYNLHGTRNVYKMKDLFTHLFSAPSFKGDEEKTWRASLLNAAIYTCVFVVIFVVIGNLIGGRTPTSVFILDGIMITVLFLIRRVLVSGRVSLAGALIITFGIGLITIGAASLGTIRTPTTAFLILIVIIAGLTHGKTGLLLSATASSLAVLGLILAENAGLLPKPDTTVTVTQWISYTVAFGLTGMLTNYAYQSTQEALKRAINEAAGRRRSQDAFENLVNYSLQAFVIIQDEKFVFANQEAERLSGYTREELYAMAPEKVFSMLLEEDREERQRALKNRLNGAELPSHVQFRINRKDGETRWLESFTSVINYQGRPAIQAAYLDITEQKQAEEQLRKLSRAIEAAPVSVVITDRNANIEYVNPHFSNLTGYKENEVIGKSSRIMQSGKTPPEAYSELWKAILDGQSWQGEFINKRKDGSFFIESAKISPIFDKDKNITHFVAIKQDITERKRTEEELRASEANFREVFDNIAHGIFINDITEDGEFRSGMLNKADELLTTIRREDVEGKLLKDLPFPAEFIQAIQENYNRCLEAGTSITYEEEFNLPGAGQRFFYTTLTPVRDIMGRFYRIIGSTIEITDLKRMEEREHQQRILAEALRDSAVAINSSLEQDKILDTLLESINRVVQFDAMHITWFDDGQVNVLKWRGYTPEQEKVMRIKFSLEDYPSFRQVFESHQPLVISDVEEYPSWIPSPEARWVRSHIKVPIIINGQVTGALNLHSKTPGYYSDNHAQILKIFADQVAIAVRNSLLYEEVQNLATTDELTGLYNRRGFLEICHREIGRLQRYNRPLSVLFVDIDHFKQFNDRYSYEVGDQVLKSVAENLKLGVREIDVVGRYGGEEIVILLPEVDQKNAVETAERLRMKIESLRVSSDEGQLGITASFGVATLVPDPGKTIVTNEDQQAKLLEDLIAKAGGALHFAKQQGRNRVVVYK